MSFPLGPLQDADNRLRHAFADLSRQWQATQEDWLDERRRRFEREHLSELGPSLSRLSAAIQELAEAVRIADRAVEDEDVPQDGLD